MTDATPTEDKKTRTVPMYLIPLALVVGAGAVPTFDALGVSTANARDRSERACTSVTVGGQDRLAVLSAVMTQSLCDLGEGEHEGFACRDGNDKLLDGAFISYDLTDNKGKPAKKKVLKVDGDPGAPALTYLKALAPGEDPDYPDGREERQASDGRDKVSAVDYRPAEPAGPSTLTVKLCTQREFTDTPRQR